MLFYAVQPKGVMIYFDRPTQQKLINRFWDLLEPGGYLNGLKREL
ncbi:MAG: CheR family methyltransferase [Deltaproteobacteria bacterium]|jgi:chemotaxis protein methyltransferase CheR|nr:CheR family methyltransferase [Deltaproteobacteria bacterium]